MIVAIVTPIINETIYVMHVPHIDKTRERRRQWWDDLAPLTAKWPPTIVLADVNGQVDASPSPGFGTTQPRLGPTNKDDGNGRRLRLLAEQCSLYCVNTH